MPATARQSALDVLNTLENSRFHLDRLMNDMVNDGSELSKRDRDLANAIVYGVLRWRRRLDWIIDRHSSRRIDKINPAVANILRIGIFQIFYLDRIPVSAAVNTSVDMTKKNTSSWLSGFVNAVLRNAARKKSSLAFPDIDEDPQKMIPLVKSFPDWLINRWLLRFGMEETLKLCDACNVIPPLTLRTNTLKVKRDELAIRLKNEANNLNLTSYSPDGINLHEPKVAIHKMTSFNEGLFQVQDEAAQLISYFLDPRPGERVLDACAGLGGKTGHIAQLMKNQGEIIALDKDPQKISRLNNEMARLGIPIVSSRVIDLAKSFSKRVFGEFDRILLDAPCSGLGVIRRNPDIKWDNSRQNLKQYHFNQLRLLLNVSRVVKRDGVIIYAVCSFEPEENEIVINDFLKTHHNFKICKKLNRACFDPAHFFDDNGFFRTLPHHHQMDGFFAAGLQRVE